MIGRIVAFRDPMLAKYAWDHGEREQVIQTPDGQPYSGYGGFTNFADPVVRDYNIDIAEEAAEARRGRHPLRLRPPPGRPPRHDGLPRPEGRGPGVDRVASWPRRGDALEPTGAFLGASLFGIAAFRPEEVAQDVARIARNVDYVAPLIYPSHWGPGVYGVPEPEREPKKIIEQSLIHFNELVEGTGARVVPWLQDFSLRVTYGPEAGLRPDQRRQGRGRREWILWDANVTYTAKARCLKA